MRAQTIVGAGLLLSLQALGVVHEHLAAVPSGWTLVEEPEDSTLISLSVALVQQNLDQLESKLSAVSTPGHSQYGQYLDADDIKTQFPSVSDTEVIAWLKSGGVSEIHSTGSSVNFATTVGTANKLLNTTFAYYSSDNVQKLRTTKYSIPDSLTSHIDLISPTTYFGKTTASRSISAIAVKRDSPVVDTSCQKIITPSCLKQLYSVSNYTPDPKAGSRLGFGSFLNQSAIYSDLFQFEKYFNITSQNFSVVLINGGTNDQDLDTAQYGEADLDVEVQVGISHPLPITEFITGGSPPFIPDLDESTSADNEPYLPYYEYLLSQPNEDIPQVISNSYGDDEQTVPEAYAKRVCNLIGLIGLRGVSVLESSGDLGVGAACQTNDGTKTPRFGAIFPASCPYLTAVGGTQAVTPEVAWVASSGGFSDYFPQPWYQASAVEEYLSEHVSESTKQYYSQYTNFSGRGFPDVSAHSLTPDYYVIEGGSSGGSGGTSAAAPAFAAVVALLNDARLRAGKGTLGFLNPFFYLLGYKGLNDITGGAAEGCNGVNLQSGQSIPGASIIPWAKWNATEGWDPSTGLGTPNFEALKEIVLSF